MKTHAIITALMPAVMLVPTPAVAQARLDRDEAAVVAAFERTLVELIARAGPSVVAISRSPSGPMPDERPGDVFAEIRENTQDDPAWSITGAGVIIDPAGLVLTQYLAVRDGERHTVATSDGGRHRATIRAADPRSGLAVLQIDPAASGRFSAVRIAAAEKLRKGQFVVVIGNPFAIAGDGGPTASWGTVTNLAEKAPPGTNLNNAPGPQGDHRTTLHHLGTLIQTDAKLGWSSGGGALLNLRGELVGLTTTAATIAGHEQPAGYAIPMNATIRRAIETLKQGREVEYGMLGVVFSQSIVEATTAGRQRLTVAQVYPGSPAERAGIAAGDVLTRIGDRPVDDIDSVQLAASAMPPSSTTTISYERAGRGATASLTLAKLATVGEKIVTVRPEAWEGIHIDYATALDAASLAQAIASGAYDPEGCVLVRDVERQSNAWQAGVRSGMFISHVAGERVASPEEFRMAVRGVEELDELRFTQPIR